MEKLSAEFFEGRLWFFYRNIACAIDKILSPSIVKAGLSPIQARILFSVCESREISVGELSEEIRMNAGNCSTMCKKLERDNYIKRYRSKEDERIVLLSPTEFGEGVVKKILHDTHETHMAMLEDFSEEQREEILTGLDKAEAFFKMLRCEED